MRKLCYDYNMKNGRNTAGQFTEGNSGKPKGSRNKAKIAIERVFLSPLKVPRNTNLSKTLVLIHILFPFLLKRLFNQT